MFHKRMASIVWVGSLPLGLMLFAGCAQIAVNKAENVWEAGKKSIVGMREADLRRCAGEPNSESTTSTGSRLRYGYAERYSSASAWCIINFDVVDGSISRFTIQSQNQGGLTDGSFTCAPIIDECFGDGTLENTMRNSPGTITSGRMEGNLNTQSAAYSVAGRLAADAGLASSMNLAAGLARDRTPGVARTAQVPTALSRQSGPVAIQAEPQRLAANNARSGLAKEPAGAPGSAVAAAPSSAPEASRSPTANSESAPKVSLDSQIISNGAFNLWRIKLTNSGSSAVRCFVSATFGYSDPNSTGKIVWDSATRTVTVPARGTGNADYGKTDRNIQADSYRLMSCSPA